jgi:hypothetical protein
MIMSHDNKGKAMSARPDRMDATRRRGAPGGGAAAALVAAISMLAFAVMPLPAPAAAPPSVSALQQNPQLANLQIDIWPEYDRQAALVILKGELAADVALPAAVSLRIPASSGGPAAVAYASGPRAELYNLSHDRTPGKDFITLRFEAPQRFFHVEFYDPLAKEKEGRRYIYVWPGDLAVDRLRVRLQEPAAANGISVEPDLGAGAAGPDGLLYRTAELGAFDAGKPLPIEIRYTKADPRTSAEILGPGAPDPAPGTTAGAGEPLPAWLLILMVVAAMVIGGSAASLWWLNRAKAFAPRTGGAGFCAQCGVRLGAGARFCAACGAPAGNQRETPDIHHGKRRNHE